MTSKDYVLTTFCKVGRQEAETLRTGAADMTGTEIIDNEEFIPDFKNVDYCTAPRNTPVEDDGQVWLLLQPYDARVHTARPKDLRAMWGLAHTKNPNKAKPYVAPFGTSGLYMTDECCIDNGNVYRCEKDNTAYSPAEYPANWSPIDSADTPAVDSETVDGTEDDCPEWEQRYGHNAYQIGDLCIYKGTRYINQMADNTYPPDVHGWEVAA